MIRRTLPLAIVATLLFLPRPSAAGWDEGVAAFKSGNFAQAAKEFQALTDQRPDCGPCFLMYGQALLKQNKAAEAVTQLRKAYDISPSDDGIRLPLAQAYLQAKRYDDAVQLLKTMDPNALAKDKQQVYFQMRAVALEKSGRGDQAVDDLKRAAQANPRSADAQYAYGSAALSARDTDDAIPALEAAVKLDPKDVNKKSSLAKAYLLRGRQTPQEAAKQRSYAQASDVAQELVASNGSYDNLMLLGAAQLGARQFAGAIDTFSRASQSNASDWLPLFYLGQARTIQGQLDQAEQNLKSALGKAKAAQDQKRIWSQLGFVYEKQKKYDEAKMAYSKVGDPQSIARVEQNQQIAEKNKNIEDYNQQVDQLEQQKKALEEQMKDLPPNR